MLKAFIAETGVQGTNPGEFQEIGRMTLNRAADRLYVVDPTANLVSIFVASTLAYVSRFSVPAVSTLYITTNEATGDVYTMHDVNPNTEINRYTGAGAFISQRIISIPNRRGIAVEQSTGLLGMGNQNFNVYERYDYTIDSIITSTPIGTGSSSVQDVAINKVTHEAYVLSFDVNTFIEKFAAAPTALSTPLYNVSFPFSGSYGGLSIDKDDNVYQTKFNEVFSTKGVQFYGYRGRFGSVGSGPGQFNVAVGTETDAAGFVYVGDYNNYRIQKFGPTETTFNNLTTRSIGDTNADIDLESSQTGAAYGVIVPRGDPTPTSAQVQAGQDSTSTPVPAGHAVTGEALSEGSLALREALFKNLKSGYEYDSWFVLTGDVDDGSILQASPTKLEITTTTSHDYNLIHDVDTEYEDTNTQNNNVDSVQSPGDTDPQFTSPGIDFELQPGSPGIDAAAPSILHPDIPTVDVFGTVRTSDIGAVETPTPTVDVLYGITGDGATSPNELYTIDKLTALPTFFLALSGPDFSGEAIAYNSTDGFMYRWTGGTMEKIDLTTMVITPVPMSGSPPAGGVKSATYDSGAGVFYVIAGTTAFYHITSAGVATLIGGTSNYAGLEMIGPTLYGTDAFAMDLHTINPATAGSLTTVSLTISGPTDSMNGLAYDAGAGVLYGILSRVFGSPRFLVTINEISGAMVEIGPLGDKFSDLSMGASGAMSTASMFQDYNLIHNVETEYENTTTQIHNVDLTNDPGNTDPQFKDTSIDLSLTSGSPAIDAAGDQGVYSDIPLDDILGTSRESDIGAFEFIPANADPPIPESGEPIEGAGDPCVEPVKPSINFFDFLTTFWDHLTEPDRNLFRNYWLGAVETGNYLWKLAGRFLDVINPETARTCVTDEFYDIQIGPFYSRPLNLDPTLKEPNNIIRPLSLFLVEPIYVDEVPVYRDHINLTKTDYDKIRDIGLGTYAVVTPKNEEINKQYFKVFNLLSSEEAKDRFTSARINGSLNEGASPAVDDFAEILITGTETGIEERTVLISDNGATASSVTWGGTTLVIAVRTAVIDSGTTDGTTADHLIDSAQNFITTVNPGDIVHNTTQDTYTKVQSVVGNDDLLLDKDIIVSGEDYEIIPDQVSEFLVAAASPSGTPWATFSDKSGYNAVRDLRKSTMPIYTIPIEIDDMPNFIFEETGAGRHIPTVGQIWRWFDGYSLLNGTVGESIYGEYVPDMSKARYVIVLDGDMSYLQDESFTFYLTTNRSYDIDEAILDVPSIQSFITDGPDPEFAKDRDYTFKNNIVEFNNDLFDIGDYSNGDYLYSRKADRIEDYLFSNYGTIVDNPSWVNYNYNKFSGKAAINSLMLSLQNSSRKEDYERALNVYYGLPVSPQDSKVIGLYESFGYEILSINANKLTLDLKDGEPLHKFIQKRTRLFSEGNKDVKVFEPITNLDREDGVITVDDASNLKVGDRLHAKLRNKWNIKRVEAEDDPTIGDPAIIEIFSPEGDGAIKHVIETINTLSKGTIYPEIIVYGTEDLETSFNGIYHITDANAQNANITNLTVYRAAPGENPLYNDYVGVTDPIDLNKTLKAGFVHMPWPTHKFLHLLMNGEKYFKAYLDAPIDTIYDEEDLLKKYQIIARNVSAINDKEFPDWNQFDQFKKFNGLSLQSNMLELTKILPGATFGEFFPNRIQDISQ